MKACHILLLSSVQQVIYLQIANVIMQANIDIRRNITRIYCYHFSDSRFWQLCLSFLRKKKVTYRYTESEKKTILCRQLNFRLFLYSCSVCTSICVTFCPANRFKKSNIQMYIPKITIITIIIGYSVGKTRMR